MGGYSLNSHEKQEVELKEAGSASTHYVCHMLHDRVLAFGPKKQQQSHSGAAGQTELNFLFFSQLEQFSVWFGLCFLLLLFKKLGWK